ncbi:hypothetical protein KEM55_004882 [Ascosphaera atra]|nr:hypothetical protein KEM55_004882 [Ascosphaera atra]
MGYEDGGMPDLPLKYKTARFMNRHEKLTIKTVPLDYPRGDELLVKVLACGLCYADVLTQTSLPQCN